MENDCLLCAVRQARAFLSSDISPTVVFYESFGDIFEAYGMEVCLNGIVKLKKNVEKLQSLPQYGVYVCVAIASGTNDRYNYRCTPSIHTHTHNLQACLRGLRH